MGHLGRRPLVFGLQMIAKAVEDRREQRARQEWLALLPWMTEKTYKPFEEFYRERTMRGRTPLTRRPKEEILAEVEAIRKAATRRTA